MLHTCLCHAEEWVCAPDPQEYDFKAYSCYTSAYEWDYDHSIKVSATDLAPFPSGEKMVSTSMHHFTLHIKLYTHFFIIPPFEWIRILRLKGRWGIASPPHIWATELDLLSMFKITDLSEKVYKVQIWSTEVQKLKHIWNLLLMFIWKKITQYPQYISVFQHDEEILL